MKLDDDFNSSYEKGKFQTTITAVAVIAIVTVIVFVLILNSDSVKRTASSTKTASIISEIASIGSDDTSDEVIDDYVPLSTLHPEDLDFYEMYHETSESVSVSEEEPAEVEEDPATDGKHTLVVMPDGTEEWVSISKYITKNIYDYTNLSDLDGIKEYTYNNRVVSAFGVDVSKDQGYIDYVKLQKAGVDFVMIRVGARGYSSGQITIDEYFEDNIRRASGAGLDIGVYFLSQAITEEEAEEEAELVIDKIKDYKLIYPVAFVMEYTEGDTARVEALNKNEKSMVARAFLKKIEEAEYKPILYGTKAWLIKYIELNKVVSDFDVWLSEDADMPTYPYEFTMWQYNKKGSISGISGDVSFNISFVDYSLR